MNYNIIRMLTILGLNSCVEGFESVDFSPRRAFLDDVYRWGQRQVRRTNEVRQSIRLHHSMMSGRLAGVKKMSVSTLTAIFPICSLKLPTPERIEH